MSAIFSTFFNIVVAPNWLTIASNGQLPVFGKSYMITYSPMAGKLLIIMCRFDRSIVYKFHSYSTTFGLYCSSTTSNNKML